MKIGNFKPGKKVTVFFVFFACTFFILGLWQIERGQAKSKIIAQFNSNLKEDASYISDTSIKWDRVLVDGEWDGAEQILIDNVINSGIAGYKVLTPLKIKSSDRYILVDRGWVAQKEFRNDLPNIDIENITASVKGILEDPELGFVLSDELVTDTWPKVSQTKNVTVLLKEYDQKFLPFVLVADPTLRNSLEYVRITPSTMMPIKHYGYSAQWFTMLLAICLMYLWIGFKKNEE